MSLQLISCWDVQNTQIFEWNHNFQSFFACFCFFFFDIKNCFCLLRCECDAFSLSPSIKRETHIISIKSEPFRFSGSRFIYIIYISSSSGKQTRIYSFFYYKTIHCSNKTRASHAFTIFIYFNGTVIFSHVYCFIYEVDIAAA